jgi:NADH:ubiquinone oxidoreductase subunit 3 (subunit A)
MTTATKPSPEITRAAERYLEQYGEPLVMNTYLKITILVLAVVCLALAALLFKSQKALADMHPLIVRITAYECKGYRSPVGLSEVEKWLTQKVPTIHAALKGQDRYSSAEFAFEFWTASSFEPGAENLLQEAKRFTRRYRIGWKNGVDIRKYAESIKAPGLRKIIDDHYFKDILAHPAPEKAVLAEQPETISV